jgi:hypothetical protein
MTGQVISFKHYPAEAFQGLCRTASTYGYDLELSPRENEMYVVCKDGSVASLSDPERKIGWELHEGAYRIAQYGHDLEKVMINHHYTMPESEVPEGKGVVGNRIEFVAAKSLA